MSHHDQLSGLLSQIKAEMQAKKLWQATPPSAEAMASQQPFCVDTLTFCEWVQWIMLPRFEQMLAAGMPLPSNSDIYSMAEEALKLEPVETSRLAKLFLDLDNCLRTPH